MPKTKKEARNSQTQEAEIDCRLTSIALSQLTRSGMKVEKQPVNLEDIKLSEAEKQFLCLSIHRALKVREMSGNVLSFTATKDIKKGETVLVMPTIAMGAKHVPDCQDQMALQDMGSFGAEELAARALRLKEGEYTDSRDWGAFIKLSKDGESLDCGNMDPSMLLESLAYNWDVEASQIEAWTLQALKRERKAAIRAAEKARKEALEEAGQA